MIKYEFTKQDIIKYLKQKRKITNIILILFGTIIYFYITYYLIFTNLLETFLYYLLYLLVLIIIIIVFNKIYYRIIIKKNKNIFGIYEVEIKKDRIIVIINNNKHEYLNNNVKKYKETKKYLIIKYQNHTSLLFMKNLISNNDIDKVIKML